MTRAHVNVVKPAGRRPTAGQALEGGLSAPITSRSEFIAARIVAFVVAGLVAMFLLDDPHGAPPGGRSWSLP